jgi:hypothetical protein
LFFWYTSPVIMCAISYTVNVIITHVRAAARGSDSPTP